MPSFRFKPEEFLIEPESGYKILISDMNGICLSETRTGNSDAAYDPNMEHNIVMISLYRRYDS
jgi:hypothetical protein